MDGIEVIASTIEYNLVPITPLICYCFLIAFCSFATGVILKKRTILKNFLIVGLTFVIISICIGVTIGFNLSDANTFTSDKTGILFAQLASSTFFWVIIVCGSFYAVLIVTLHQIHLFEIIGKFFSDLEKDIVEHKFHFISHTAKLFKFNELLTYQQNLANIFLVPTCGFSFFTAGVGLVFQFFGFPTRFSKSFGRFLYMGAFGGVAVYLLLSYAFITFIFSYKYETAITISIEKMRDQMKEKNLKEQAKTIEELRRYESFTKNKLFQFKLGTVIPLTFESIIGKATLVITLVTLTNTLFPILIKQFYTE